MRTIVRPRFPKGAIATRLVAAWRIELRLVEPARSAIAISRSRWALLPRAIEFWPVAAFPARTAIAAIERAAGAIAISAEAATRLGSVRALVAEFAFAGPVATRALAARRPAAARPFASRSAPALLVIVTCHVNLDLRLRA